MLWRLLYHTSTGTGAGLSSIVGCDKSGCCHTQAVTDIVAVDIFKGVSCTFSRWLQKNVFASRLRSRTLRHKNIQQRWMWKRIKKSTTWQSFTSPWNQTLNDLSWRNHTFNLYRTGRTLRLFSSTWRLARVFLPHLAAIQWFYCSATDFGAKLWEFFFFSVSLPALLWIGATSKRVNVVCESNDATLSIESAIPTAASVEQKHRCKQIRFKKKKAETGKTRKL